VAKSSLINSTRQRNLRWWIIGLTLLALLLAGIAVALRGPVAAGVDDGTAPAGHMEEENEVPRSLRQYAATPPPAVAPVELRAA
jgi:hypothetical protein